VRVTTGTAGSTPTVGLLGVPTSAGSHNAGQDKAPAVLRAAGLAERLAGHGISARDFGDLPMARHRPQPRVDGVRDLGRVSTIVGQTAERVSEIREAGLVPLVIGGDCTITLGVVGGVARREDAGLIYFDGDADLSLPATSGSGVLDTMGMAHLLGDGVPALSRSGPRFPLLRPGQVELFGFDPGELDTGEWSRLTGRGLHATPAPAVQEDPAGRAAAALSRLEQEAGAVVVHFDVDVLDTGAFPLANFPHFAGLTLEEAAACLGIFCRSGKLAGLVVTEVNPDHDPDEFLVPTLIDTLCDALRPAGG
jgi:arginase